jgi:hypothetical protein
MAMMKRKNLAIMCYWENEKPWKDKAFKGIRKQMSVKTLGQEKAQEGEHLNPWGQVRKSRGRVSSWNAPTLLHPAPLPIALCTCWDQPDDLAAFGDLKRDQSCPTP